MPIPTALGKIDDINPNLCGYERSGLLRLHFCHGHKRRTRSAPYFPGARTNINGLDQNVSLADQFWFHYLQILSVPLSGDPVSETNLLRPT